MDTTVWLGRLATLPLAFLEWGIVLWYLNYWDLFPKLSFKRLIPWFLVVLSIPTVILVQIFIYREITLSGAISDVVFKLILGLEQLVAVALVFWFKKRGRKDVG